MGHPRVADQETSPPPPDCGGPAEARMNELSPELTRQALRPAMHEKILFRAAELVELGWTRGTAARDAEGQKARSTTPQTTAWCVVGAVDPALDGLLNLDAYALPGGDVDAYDTAPCPLEVMNEFRRPLQRVLGRRDLANWNDHACPGPAAADSDGTPRASPSRAGGPYQRPARFLRSSIVDHTLTVVSSSASPRPDGRLRLDRWAVASNDMSRARHSPSSHLITVSSRQLSRNHS